jgi:hypothetical protein
MNRSKRVASGLVVALGMVVATQLWAFPEFARQTKAACATCHVSAAGGAVLSDAGKAFKADSKTPAAGTAKAAEYVGGNKCRMCHIKQAKAWLETQHAKAWAGLQHADSTKVAALAAALKIEIKGTPAATDECVKCHVTGFQLASGYPQADSTKAANLANVTCEACHGPGSLHVAAATADKKKFINRGVTANMCMQCHTPVTSPTFKFEEFVKRGAHAVAVAK